MTDLFQEVLNDAQNERKILFFRRILPLVVVLTIIIAIAIAVWGWHQRKLQKQNQQFSDQLVVSIEGESSVDNLKILIQDDSNRQTSLAHLLLVEQLVKDNRQEEAYQELDKITNQASYDIITKSYAHLLYLNLILVETNLSETQKGQARDHIEYFHKEDQPFFVNATLLKALFYQKVKQYDLAVQQAELILNIAKVSDLVKDQAKAVIANVKYYM